MKDNEKTIQRVHQCTAAIVVVLTVLLEWGFTKIPLPVFIEKLLTAIIDIIAYAGIERIVKKCKTRRF